MTSTRIHTAFFTALVGLALGAVSAESQRIVPSVGLYVPVSELGAVEGVDGAVNLGKKESTRAYGVGLEWGAGRVISLRGNIA